MQSFWFSLWNAWNRWNEKMLLYLSNTHTEAIFDVCLGRCWSSVLVQVCHCWDDNSRLWVTTSNLSEVQAGKNPSAFVFLPFVIFVRSNSCHMALIICLLSGWQAEIVRHDPRSISDATTAPPENSISALLWPRGGNGDKTELTKMDFKKMRQVLWMLETDKFEEICYFDHSLFWGKNWQNPTF